MELYKKYFFIIFIFSFLKSIEIDKNQIIDLSNLDFSTIENSEYQINYGLHSNFFSYDFLNFSIDKLISENLFLSLKLSKYRIDELYVQNSISVNPKVSKINYFFSFNFFTLSHKINNWFTTGILLDHSFADLVQIYFGPYYDIAFKHEEYWKSQNYYLAFKLNFFIKNNVTLSHHYNKKNKTVNHALEFSLSL